MKALMQPHSVEAEESVLGSMLIDPHIVVPLVLSQVSVDDFFVVKHKWIFDAILALHRAGTSVDFVTVLEQLTKDGKLEQCGGMAYISHLTNVVPTSIHAGAYSEIVASHSRRRSLIDAASSIARLAYDTDMPIEKVEAQAATTVLSNVRGGAGTSHISVVARQFLGEVEYYAEHPTDGVRGLSTGFYAVDRLLGGIDKETLNIVAGRPGMGKSAFAFQVVENVARNGMHCLVFSLEMSRRQFFARLACGHAAINWQDVRRGNVEDDDFSRLMRVSGDLAELPIHINDSTDITSTQVSAIASTIHAVTPLSLIVVDHLGIMSDSGDNEVLRLGKISRNLKRCAKSIAPVLALCQLNRSVEHRMDKRPNLSDLRQSGEIEQDADTVLMLYRDSYYNNSDDETTEVYARKNRDGESGSVAARLMFKRKFARFYNLDNSAY